MEGGTYNALSRTARNMPRVEHSIDSHGTKHGKRLLGPHSETVSTLAEGDDFSSEATQSSTPLHNSATPRCLRQVFSRSSHHQ